MNEIVIRSGPSEVVIALLKDKKLIELHKENFNKEFAVGDIYLGKINRVVPGLNAAFVGVGYEKDAFLHYHDLGPQVRSLNKFLQHSRRGKQNTHSLGYFKREKDIVKTGTIDTVLKAQQEVLVQIDKEPISTKGPRISSELSLPGRYLVLVPFSDRVSVSQRIADKDEKDRLKRLVTSIRPKNFGVIIRTNAVGKKVADLDKDLKDLLNKWKNLHNNLRDTSPPSKILGELSRTSALLRDILNDSFESITVDNDEIYEEIVDYVERKVPGNKSKVKLYEGKLPIFDKMGIAKQIKASFGRTVTLKSGIYLIIEHTEALHVIDVNSGNRSKSDSDQETNALEVNLEAADEIARQLRLRDMGGIIVIDFIDMKNSDNRKKLYNRMKEAMAEDKAKHAVLPPSKFGLIQITRQRVRPETNVTTNETCASCNGTGTSSASVLLVDEIESQIRFLASDKGYKSLRVSVHPYVASFINKGLISKRRKWQWAHKVSLKVQAAASLPMLEYRFFDKKNNKITLDS